VIRAEKQFHTRLPTTSEIAGEYLIRVARFRKIKKGQILKNEKGQIFFKKIVEIARFKVSIS
jgi:hypothetical protein